MIKKFVRTLKKLRAFRNDAIYTLNGWRFADLKRYIDSSAVVTEDSQSSFIMMARLFAPQFVEGAAETRAKIALVTCLPPDDTGIARYSLQHLLNTPHRLDAFSFVRDVSNFMYNSAILIKKNNKLCNLFPLATLLSMDEINEYQRIVFVIGNSDHNIEVYRAMENFVKVKGAGRVTCYLHDPCCHNIVQMGKNMSHEQYSMHLNKIYSEKFSRNLPIASDSWRVHRNAIESGVLGARSILNLGVRSFVVNSKAAKELLLNDFGRSELDDLELHQLYHPVFDLERKNGAGQATERLEADLILGTYGVPGASKCTDLVIEATEELLRRGKRVKLIVAGYQAFRYLHGYFGGHIPEWIIPSEPATESELQDWMLKCDLALQFREKNLGESSGVVPTLINMKKTVLVSKVGSFEDYGDAVIYFSGSAKSLADLIEVGPVVPVAAMADYVSAKSPQQFGHDFAACLLGAGS